MTKTAVAIRQNLGFIVMFHLPAEIVSGLLPANILSSLNVLNIAGSLLDEGVGHRGAEGLANARCYYCERVPDAANPNLTLRNNPDLRRAGHFILGPSSLKIQIALASLITC